MVNLKEEDVVLCTVKRIEGTTVFLEIEGDGEGSMVLSEVAAGRIRNLREYVVPNKKVVCKVLKVEKGRIELSLRRVTSKEKEEVMERYNKEKNLISILKVITSDYESILSKIKESKDIPSFIEEAKENPTILSKYMKKEEAEKLSKLLKEKEGKNEKESRKIITIKVQDSESGISDIKSILHTKEVDIKYLGSSQFLAISKGKDFKEANITLTNVLKEIEKMAKEKKAIFEIKES